MSLKAAQAETALETALQKTSGQSGPEDGKVPEESTFIANALQSIREASSAVTSAAPSVTPPTAQQISFWVYLGSRQNNAWQTVLFDVSDVPHSCDAGRNSFTPRRVRKAARPPDVEWAMDEG